VRAAARKNVMKGTAVPFVTGTIRVAVSQRLQLRLWQPDRLLNQCDMLSASAECRRLCKP
jgi:hypothetical protein